MVVERRRRGRERSRSRDSSPTIIHCYSCFMLHAFYAVCVIPSCILYLRVFFGITFRRFLESGRTTACYQCDHFPLLSPSQDL